MSSKCKKPRFLKPESVLEEEHIPIQRVNFDEAELPVELVFHQGYGFYSRQHLFEEDLEVVGLERGSAREDSIFTDGNKPRSLVLHLYDVWGHREVANIARRGVTFNF